MITVLLLILLLVPSESLYAGQTDSAAVDSLKRISRRDSLIKIQETNRRLYDHTPDRNDAFSVSTPDLFGIDAAAPSEALENAPLCVPVRFGLSSQLNRFLVYGNVAPVSRVVSSGGTLFFPAFDLLKGTDDVSATEFSSISLLPNNRCRYAPWGVSGITVPEASIYWENGVFGENVLNVRFMRPLSERLSVSVFSNYRHFDAVRFSHEGNSVLSFYQSFYRDTAAIVNRGYNPFTNEYAGGARLEWAGTGGNRLYFGAKYLDGLNETALNRPAKNLWARLNQYRTTFDAGSVNNRYGMFAFDGEARFDDNALVRRAPDAGATAQVRDDGADREVSLAGRITTELPDSAQAALTCRIQRTDRKGFDLSASSALEQTPTLSLTLPVRTGPFRSVCSASAGYTLYRFDNVFGYTPSWSASVEAALGGQRLRAYAAQGGLPYDIPYDSVLFVRSRILDLYRIGGGEISLVRGLTAFVLGCQSIEGIERTTVQQAWPEATPPYEQPRLVVLAAPSLGPWRGFALTSRTLLSDRKPIVKTQAAFSYAAHPAGTREYIDVRLGVDYWSRRDACVFADRSDWNREVINVTCEVTAHVSTFRFFAKIDNLLDRKYAYVPGYYSAGVTFRWGISWYLQK